MNHYRASVLPCMLVLCAWGTAYGQHPDQGHGRVGMQGSIIETPCAIATADRDQTVNMGEETVGNMIHNGMGLEHKFSLNLVNCDLQSYATSKQDWSWFRTTFDGPVDGGIFSVNGASGIGLQITDAAGNIAIPGQPLPAASLVAGTQRLDYTLRLIGNHQQLKTGVYRTILRFKVDYF